jgi:hypothetical protein
MDIENQNARDARVEKLWKKLDIKQKGELDLEDLQKGLHKIDHRQQAESPVYLASTNNLDSSEECERFAPRSYESGRYQWGWKDSIRG